MKRFLLASIFLLTASLAYAWSDAGHKLSASIAFRQMTPAEQAKIVVILKHHPRYEQDFKSRMPPELTTEAEQNEWMFQQAAVWPDIARGFQGDDQIYHHATWHYINLPLFVIAEDSKMPLTVNTQLDPPQGLDIEEMNAIQTIRKARKKLVDKNVSDEQKALWICWLFHCVGDIHQPLHSSALFAKTLFPTGDRGGNSIRVEQGGNLHSLWDGFLGRRDEFRNLRNRAIEFVNDKDKSKLGAEAATKLDEQVWLNESHKLCDTMAYDAEVRGHLRGYLSATEAPPVQLTERYLKAGGQVSQTRIVEAGFRLGAITKAVAIANMPGKAGTTTAASGK